MAAWRDGGARYGIVSRLMHWAVALLLIWQFTIISAYAIVGESERLDAIASVGPAHGEVGLLLILFTVPRGIWALFNRKRRPHDAGVLGRLARISHVAVYALMLAIPVLALMRVYGSGKGWHHLGVQIVPQTGERVEWMVAVGNLAHSNLGWVLMAMIAGHVAMVLVHRLWLRDGVLSRMA